jgi:site-specific recombinase XerD
MSRVDDLAGAAHLMLAADVAYLDPAPAVFEAMLEGWTCQQRTRFLKDSTIRSRTDLVLRFAEFTNEYPWQWQPPEVEAFIGHLRSGSRPIVVSTARSYQHTLRLFMEYVTDGRYGWPEQCQERFGQTPVQILHEWNTVTHVAEYEGDPRRRPLTYDEVQALFDMADSLVERIRARGRKGALAAQRDAIVLKTIYAFGLRRREAWGLDLPTCGGTRRPPKFGNFGALFVRWGKSSNGSPPKRRTVLTVPEMDWIVPVLEQWVGEIRPAFGPGQHQGLWVTERAGRLSPRAINQAFEAARSEAGLPERLDLHCLRHSYITHLVEFDYPERFVQDQVGHAYASTTAIYTGVSDEYRNRLLRRSLERDRELWEDKA